MAQSQNRRNTWEGPNGRTMEARTTELLNLYIYDYCKKKKFNQAARAFSLEASVPTDQSPPFDVSTGFLADWWNIFWDIYYAKSKEAEASKEANIIDEYHNYLRAKRDEVLQQQRAFNMHQAQQSHLQQRRASEIQRVQSPQSSIHPQQETPHLQHAQPLPRESRPSPTNSTASLPTNSNNNASTPNTANAAGSGNNNNSDMLPPPSSSNTMVSTPQNMPASLPQQSQQQPQQQQHIPARHTASPSFSPQQMQRGPDMSSNANSGGNSGSMGPMSTPADMMNSPIVGQQIPMQQSVMTPLQRTQQHNAMVNVAMAAVGLGGRDQQSLTAEERNILHAHIRKMQINQVNQINMMRNNPMMVNNPQARFQMQQHAMLQQQQQQQAMLQQQHMQQHQHQQAAAAAAAAAAVAAQQHPQQGTPQQQQQQAHNSQHTMSQSPQIDVQRNMMGPAGPGNGQARPHMIGPGNQMAINPNMQNPSLMNGSVPFSGEMSIMLAQQAMNKRQMPGGLTPQQQQQHQLMSQQRMMQQRLMHQAQKNQQQGQHLQATGGSTPQQQQSPAPQGSTAQTQQQQPQNQGTPQQQPQSLPGASSAGGAPPQTPPSVSSPNTSTPAGSGSPEDGDKKKNIAIALYQRRQMSHTLQQQQQVQQQFVHHPPKRQKTEDPTMASQTQTQSSPQLQHKMSPHVMHAQQHQPNSGESPVMSMQQRLVNQQRNQFEQQSSPTMARNTIAGSPSAGGQQPRGQWNRVDDLGSPSMNDVQSPAAAMNPSGMPNQPMNSSVFSFDLERFMMGDSGDFGEIFPSGDENAEQNLLMSSDGGDLDPFGGGFLASMGGGLDLDNGGMPVTSSGGSSGHHPTNALSHMTPALQLYADLPGHTNKVSTVSFSVDGQWLASAGHDRKVLIWNVKDKETAYTLDGHTAHITCARWSLDNRRLVATSSYDKTLRIWDVGSAIVSKETDSLVKKEDEPKSETNSKISMIPKQLVRLDCRAQVTAVDFAPDRPDTICSLDAEGELKVWNLNTSNCEKSLKMTQSKSGFSPNPMRFHPRTASILACAVGNQIYIIDITSAKNSTNIGNDNIGIRTINTDHGKNICSFDWSSDGSFLVASSEDKICVYETSHWKCVTSQMSQKISSCAFIHGSTDKLQLLYGGYQDIFLWQCSIPGAQPKKVGAQSGTVVSIACCPVAGQTVVASASHHPKEKNLMLWTI